ncbi:uncharacterized protein LOC135698004 [Ochlerotatus camptorhynchus]|uniref:uncharacterized protein LOC135698004 n=1 Tax=Ochlerotatus camptorhynchus TaxID=644619 RepID=UPI0031D69BA3
MAFFKVSCLVILVTVGVVLSEDIKSGIQNSVDLQDDLEGSETIGIAKKLLLIKGLGLGGLALGSQKGGFGGFEGKFSGLGGGNSLDNFAPAHDSYGSSYAAAPAPVAYAAPAPVVYSAPAPISYSAPAPIPYQVPAPVTYQAPAPVIYQAPAPISYQERAPVAYPAPYPVADVPYQPPVSSGYTGNLQVVGYLSPIQAHQPSVYSNQVSSGYYNAPPPPPPPSPFPLAPLPSLLPCEH